MSEVVIVQPLRTAIAKYNGSLAGIPAVDLGAAAIRETIARSGLAASEVASVTMGNVVQAGNRMNPARQAAIHGGLPVSVP
ncbi:acetyl-CoA C-acyltransferase, partial [Neorhizobium sp. SHOUNA12B]|nr:acetyl-CoA C-acyltransferase [Neorhizobium sp. SHOUNA12B]